MPIGAYFLILPLLDTGSYEAGVAPKSTRIGSSNFEAVCVRILLAYVMIQNLKLQKWLNIKLF